MVIKNIITRLSFAGIGVFGIFTASPNIMMSASGSDAALLAGTLGIISSGSFIMSGISGVFHNSYKLPLKIARSFGFLGIITQISAFVVPSLIYNE